VGLEAKPVATEVWTLALRAGYQFRKSPVPDQKGISNFADADTHVISTGLGISAKDPYGLVPRPVSLDVYGRVQILEEREVVKDSLANPSGDYVLGGEIYGFGASMTLRF